MKKPISLNPVPSVRIRPCNSSSIRQKGAYVIYWMIASRRLAFNYALDRALEHCRSLKKPLLILEALRCDYPFASDRLHRFVLDGMAGNAAAAKRSPVFYYPYMEPSLGAGKGLLTALSRNACVVVTDDFPCFFLPRMIGAAAGKLHVLLEAVDSNGLLPVRAAQKDFPTAFAFRRFLQKMLPQYLDAFPAADPLSNARLPPFPGLPGQVARKWPPATPHLLAEDPGALAALPIDHSVPPGAGKGGHEAARKRLLEFLGPGFKDYLEERNEPEADATSGLSPYLHFGHISVHEVFAELARREKWKSEKLSLRPSGKREGWWNMSPAAEAFLDELVTWRELGYNFCAHRNDFDRYESLPGWAKKSLAKHSRDPRTWTYSLADFESAKTHDPLWNAAQTQLLREGRIHNYLRMLWGKKILEWSPSPQEAAKIMIHLNDKYALDGRDPNSYTGIFWVLGRYDHPWPPERPVFGSIRYMSSENTARKFSVKNYLQKYAPGSKPGP